MKILDTLYWTEKAKNRIKNILPQTLFGRALLIIVTPLILMQAISTFVFFDRHWDTMTRRLAHTLAGDIAFIVDSLTPLPKQLDLNQIFLKADDILHIRLTYSPEEILVKKKPFQQWDRVRKSLRDALKERVRRPFSIDTIKKERRIEIKVQLPQGLLNVNVHEKRLYSSTPYIFLMWMIGSSLVLFAIAIIFMRNQIRPIRRLAIAARSFGMGRGSSEIKPSGAKEVRQATQAFRQMRERISRQFAQRTEMLAGVSHDLRTPLTRMKLQIEMLERTPETRELQDDIQEMERMIDGYLTFARGEGSESLSKINLASLIEEIISTERRDGSVINFVNKSKTIKSVTLRPQAIKRAITNLIINSKKYAETVKVEFEYNSEHAIITIDDNGPGIKPEHRDDVFKAFFRLDPSRNTDTGGTGLGLTIAKDIVQSHGGDLLLSEASLGGLRATITLPL
jgi:two-component system osmolarity sensor histidine kinase EnvZ